MPRRTSLHECFESATSFISVPEFKMRWALAGVICKCIACRKAPFEGPLPPRQWWIFNSPTPPRRISMENSFTSNNRQDRVMSVNNIALSKTRKSRRKRQTKTFHRPGRGLRTASSDVSHPCKSIPPHNGQYHAAKLRRTLRKSSSSHPGVLPRLRPMNWPREGCADAGPLRSTHSKGPQHTHRDRAGIRRRRRCRLSQRAVHLLSQEGKLKRCPMLCMVADKECLVLFHGLCQLLKIFLRELSGQKICPAIRLHCILHHPLVVIR